MQAPTQARPEAGASKSAASWLNPTALSYAVVFGSLAACFLVTNVTNQFILANSGRIYPLINNWLIRSQDSLYDFGGKDIPRYSLGAFKDSVFFWSFALLVWRLRREFLAVFGQFGDALLWKRIILGLLVASCLILMIFPSGHGLIYSKLSLNIFLQEPSFWHKRILPLEIASILHLSGAMYIVFFWCMTAAVIYITNLYLKSKSLELSTIEIASLCTAGVFSTALGMPGEPEILVLGLALVAILDFDRSKKSGPMQIACFGLALMSHESAAIMAFGVLGVFMFGWRFMIGYGVLLGVYVFAWLLEFGFDYQAASQVQTNFGGTTTYQTLLDHIPLAIFSALCVFKLLFVVAVAAIVKLARAGAFRAAALIACGLVGGIPLMAGGADFTRMAAFGTFAVVIALPVILPSLSPRQRWAGAVANLAIPAVAIQGHSGLWTYNGLYGLLLRRLFGAH